MMRFLKYGSLCLLLALAACSRNPYRGLATLSSPAPSVLRLKPEVSRELYRCVVDGRILFKRFHLSGLLFFKRMDDGSTRAVFQNEMGIPFFDFRWDEQDSFSVMSIMERLDKPAVINTLRTDFSLLLLKGLEARDEAFLISEGDTVSRFPLNAGHAYYRQKAGRIISIEYAGKSPVTSVKLGGEDAPRELPSSAIFTHHRAHFSIVLTKLPQHEQ